MRIFLKNYKPDTGTLAESTSGPTHSSSEKQASKALSMLGNFGKKVASVLKSSTVRFGKQNSRYTAIAVLVVVLILSAGIYFVRARGKNVSPPGTQSTQISSDGKQVALNKSFNVPIRDANGKDTGADLKVGVTNAERANDLIYNGSPLTARAGKDFLVVNLEVENSTNNRLNVRPVDFFRLVGADGKSYAADLQTDPITVEPVSTKKARTIFIVDESLKSFKLLIGDVKETQESVDVSI